MGRASTPSFVLNVELPTRSDSVLEALCRKKENCGRALYNLTPGLVLKNLRQLWADPRYRELIKAKQEAEKGSQTLKDINSELSGLDTKYHLSEYDIQALARIEGKIYRKHLSSSECAAIGTRVYYTIRRYRFGNAKQVRFCQAKRPFTVPHKTNDCGLHLNAAKREVLFGRLRFKLPVPAQDEYLNYCLDHCRVKFCCLTAKQIRGVKRYYIQIVFEGPKPLTSGQRKVQEKILAAEVKSGIPYKDMRAGIDLGVSTVAAVSSTKVMLADLTGPETEKLLKKVRELQQALDRSRRANNPDNYNPDGTAKPKSQLKTWVKSARYLKLEEKLRRTQRKLALRRRELQRRLALDTVSMGGKLFVEDMNFQGLAKRAQGETEESPVTGKCKRKKRFGSSIHRASPGTYIRYVREYAPLFGGNVFTVNAITHRASQYIPVADIYEKHPLYMRTVMAGNRPVQRDLLAAFNLSSTDDSKELNKINALLAAENFSHFLELHDAEIRRLMQLNKNLSGRHLKWYLRGFMSAKKNRCCGTAPLTAVSPERDRRQGLRETAESCGSPSGPLQK